MKVKLFLSCLAMAVLACTRPSPIFTHDIPGNQTPWTASPVERPSNKFSFAIVSDLYSGEREGVFEVAVAQLNLLSPEFVLSVGDLVDGGTEDTIQLKKEYDRFDGMVSKLRSPFFHVGGNHDLTNLVMREFWEKRYGKRYYHFVYDDVLFLMMDSEDYNPERMQQIYEARAKAIEVLDGPNPELARDMEYFKMPERVSGMVGEAQSAYFEKVIQDHPDVRWTFVLMHKPVWQREAENNLSRIESALSGKNYTVINGHFHSYSHTTRNDRDYIILGTTSGGQNPQDPMAFDHITYITMDREGPSFISLRLDGMLDKTGHIPLNGDSLCYQAARCVQKRE
ncbi:MAG: metallophosphoesterase [Cyclobacteriaceae bacterium]